MHRDKVTCYSQFLLTVSLISFAPIVLSADYNSIFRSNIGIYLLLIISLLTVSLLLILKKRGTVTVVDLIVAGYLAYSIANTFCNGQEFIDQTFFAKWGLIIVVYILSRINNTYDSIIYGLVASGLIQSTIGILQFSGILNSNNIIFDITGSFGNPGQLAGMLSICLVVGFYILKINHNRQRKTFLSFVVIIIGFVLLLTNSRAGWLASSIGIIVYYRDYISTFVRRHRYIFISILGVALIATTYLYHYKVESANGRLFIWKISSKMVAEKPICGHGAEAFGRKYMIYQAEYFTDNASDEGLTADNVIYPYNEFIKLWVEQGFIGMIAIILIFYLILKKTVRDHRNHILKSILITLAIFSCFSYPSDILGLMILFPLIIGSFNYPPLFILRNNCVRNLFIIISITTIIACINEICYYYKFKDFTENKKHIRESYNKIKNDRRFVDIYSQVVVRENDTLWALEVLSEAVKLVPSPELYCDLAELYIDKHEYGKADSLVFIAKHMVPTKIMPHYIEFKLAIAQKNEEKAIQTARNILSHKTKIHGMKYLKIQSEIILYLKERE